MSLQRCLSSPACDLASRRSVFSRKYYGSVEMLSNGGMEGYSNNAGRFRAEVGNTEKDMDPNPKNINSPVHLENPEKETRWYFKYFLGKLHQVYGGMTTEKDPFILTVVVTDMNNHNMNQYRAILWRKAGSQKLCIPYNSSSPLSIKKILSYFDIHRFEKGPKEIYSPEVQKDILTLEEQEGSVNFKFGLLYCKDGQISDEDMYNNEQGSEEFSTFIDLLGEQVKLKTWDRFKGGLDTKSDTTGEASLYTVYEGHEIMFHVSTMLPYSVDNRQQIERKRHVGNDIVNIIFVDECATDNHPSWRPSMMKTHFTHIFAVVTYNKEKLSYRLNVFAEESVPLFGPPLPSPPEFTNHQEFRDFLLVKLINGEKAAFHSPVFAQKRMRTLEMLITNILDMFTSENAKTSMLNRRAFSDIVLDQGNDMSTTKEMSRTDEFIKFGQVLKVNIIIRGDAPTSNITTGILKRVPWQPHSFCTDYSQDVICGDTWGDKLVVSTDQGTYILEENMPPLQILDKSVDIKQLEIVDSVNAMVFRYDKGKESRISVLQLVEFKGTPVIALDRGQVKKLSIEKAKGGHLFALNKPCMQPLRMIVALGRKLQIYQWRFTTTCSSLSSWNQFTTPEMTASFQFVREMPTFEPVQIITIVESGGCERICIGYKSQFDLLDEKTGDTIHLYRPESNKSQVVAAMDVCADDEPELLLCFNRTCHFQKLNRNQTIGGSHTGAEFDFSWNFEPRDVVVAFPYVLAFTENAVEIRLIINGSLVHTMTVPNCKLITSKTDIYFTTTVDNLGHDVAEKCKEGCPPTEKTGRVGSPPPTIELPEGCQDPGSPMTPTATPMSGAYYAGRNSPGQHYSFYRIPLASLSGGHSGQFGVHRPSLLASAIYDRPRPRSDHISSPQPESPGEKNGKKTE